MLTLNHRIPDEWMKEDEIERKRSVPFHSLNHEGQIVASQFLCPSRPTSSNKRKRSPHKRTNTLGTTSEPLYKSFVKSSSNNNNNNNNNNNHNKNNNNNNCISGSVKV
ncbi:hypothetical protein Anas_01199 [Armadillidium nasatum]|uniref:Uncharacterized protein n=1 Tax=Armadillidium nasatum TaxID=96803 RepID=A0A5N5T0X0_9CRUS|nr:hypothetical protein Anas_01199 [Armadillidium nasatum]